jgi:hypothetical protein
VFSVLIETPTFMEFPSVQGHPLGDHIHNVCVLDEENNS